MKRKLSIVFLFAANILLLAHSVVPHHHHREQLCLTKNHSVACNHEHMTEAHEHSASESDFCLVKSIYAVPGDLSGHRNARAVQHPVRNLFAGSHAVVSLEQTELKEYGSLADRPNLYAYLGIYSFGLRAPPMV